jgi:copper chaperone
MKIVKFKTNIKCGGCIETVTPHLNALPEVDNWEVNTTTADKVLTVNGNTEDVAKQVVDALAKAGFKAEMI